MEFTKSFPPADALVAMLQKIEYRKIANQIVTVALFAAAIAQVLFERAQVWWLNGGKEQTVKVIDFVAEKSKAVFTAVNQWLNTLQVAEQDSPFTQRFFLPPAAISFAKEVRDAADLVFGSFKLTPKL